MSTREYLSVAQTAALVRSSLKEAFSGIKFSVRSESYSGGASINIGWTDGPAEAQVNAVIGRFNGGYFDGMIDYKGSVYAMLDCKPVHFGADFIFCNRHYSDEFVTAAFAGLARHYSGNPELASLDFSAAAWRAGQYMQVQAFGGGWDQYWTVHSMLYRDLEKRTRILALHSKTAARVFVTHDDGYGQTGRSAEFAGEPS